MTEQQLTARGHKHVEAFHLMWYACPCGHQERHWNSRDGVTPYGSHCPSCGDFTIRHSRWHKDEYVPDYKPHHGQRIWVDMTRERAEKYVRALIAGSKSTPYKIEDDRFESLVLNTMGEQHGGHGPDCIIFGVNS